MSDNKKIKSSPSDVLNIFQHKDHGLQTPATQESIETLRRETRECANAIHRTDVHLEQLDWRMDKLETKFDRLQWFMVIAVLVFFFKDYIFRFIGS